MMGEPVSAARRRAAGKKYEEFPIVDTSGLVIGRATREFCHTSGLKPLHPVVHMHIIDRFSRVYLQRRSDTKDYCPGCWDSAVGGHVTYGESLEEALVRESSEEIGFKDFNPRHLLTYIFENDAQRELVTVFATISSKDPVPDNDEVQDGRFWTDEEIMKAMGTGVFTPDFEEEYVEIRKSLFALL